MARLLEKYRNDVRPKLMERFGLKNPLAAPRLDKIVISMGVGKSIADKTVLESAVRDLTLIAGQKPVITKAKTSISAFKVRQGMSIGCVVTGKQQWCLTENAGRSEAPNHPRNALNHNGTIGQSSLRRPRRTRRGPTVGFQTRRRAIHSREVNHGHALPDSHIGRFDSLVCTLHQCPYAPP